MKTNGSRPHETASPDKDPPYPNEPIEIQAGRRHGAADLRRNSCGTARRRTPETPRTTAAEHRAHPPRRHGLRRPDRNGGHRIPDAQHRPALRRRHALHQLLQRPGCQQRFARRASDGMLPQPHRIRRGARPEIENRTQPRRGDHGRKPEESWLRNRHRRQMARGMPPGAYAPRPRFRRILRTALLQRHVAPPSADVVLSAAAAVRRAQGRQPVGLGRGPGAAHHPVHGTCRRLHHTQVRRPVLPLPGPLHAARAALRLGQVQGQKRAGTVRRRDDGDRLERGRSAQGAGKERRGLQYDRRAHFGQRAVDQLRRPRRLDGRSSRRQGNHLRRRAARAVHRVVAGERSATSWPRPSTCCRPSRKSRARRSRRSKSTA